MSQKKPTKKIKPPKGTRDLYPEDLLRQQYITNAWRDAALRCGFDEIAGPTFETTELYAVKSGEGILGELFQAFSGKSPKEVERVKETGQAEFALRPEFTPTLARMYAARAKELPQPCKWFTAGPYFRAERPQRGRLREFLQWNVDAIGMPGDDSTTLAQMDREVIATSIQLFASLGLTFDDVRIHISSREVAAKILLRVGVAPKNLDSGIALLDKWDKISNDQKLNECHKIQLDLEMLNRAFQMCASMGQEIRPYGFSIGGLGGPSQSIDISSIDDVRRDQMDWHFFDPTIARGLAYYTGTVFEAIAEGERAVAGGGRYDNLIELFGGPPTPACGFGMGDVVLGNLLEDKGLMPTGSDLMDAVARPQASIRPVAFVVPNGDEDNEPLVHTLVASLRRGIEHDDWKARDDRKPWDRDRYSVAPMHARVSYKSTRNLKKLRSDAEKQHARFFVEIHADNKVELTNMDTREPITSDTHGSFSVDPSAENYVGIAIAARS
ncbi:MAG: histidine--tRNA ligase [Phycisphaerales bacterium JB047]